MSTKYTREEVIWSPLQTKGEQYLPVTTILLLYGSSFYGCTILTVSGTSLRWYVAVEFCSLQRIPGFAYYGLAYPLKHIKLRRLFTNCIVSLDDFKSHDHRMSVSAQVQKNVTKNGRIIPSSLKLCCNTAQTSTFLGRWYLAWVGTEYETPG